ncbi:hypothetical protein DPMN_033914 [Dreissena polymorpha]|uniref:C2H2-type domain-containing protein n=1 Tax=Dreissena polymorpha TaxID=45954 RepID=A0A9D4RLF5_DREPO|nr:hypothetical protein DPMN_033914 [Dreissena polymorpha]
MNNRYSCAQCGAKFKSVKKYVTHSMSHQSVGSRYLCHGLDDTRINALLGAGEQCMKEYFDLVEGYRGTFSCEECKTVFLHRDAYAMHMMVRAMNQTCKHAENKVHSSNNVDESSSVVIETSSLQSDAEDLTVSRETQGAYQQRCLEDVTSSVDQDEYLMSVLDKVCFPDPDKRDKAADVLKDGKLCSFCGGVFSDQDSLAMHVMSNHTDTIKYYGRSHEHLTPSSAIIQNTTASNYMPWQATQSHCNETFRSRDILAMHALTHRQFDQKPFEKSRNSYKRHYPTSNVEVSFAGKKSRYSSAPNGVVCHEKRDCKCNGNMFCKICNIRFNASPELTWHMIKHEQGSLPTYNKCNHNLKCQPEIEIANTTPENDPTNHDTIRLRRNSASFLTEHKSKDRYSLPKRPVSVGDISAIRPLSVGDISATRPVSVGDISATRHVSVGDISATRPVSVGDISATKPVSVGDISATRPVSVDDTSTTTKLQSLQPGHTEIMHTAFSLTQGSTQDRDTPLDTATDISSVLALSTNEQRIIYSVFGKDLDLKFQTNKPKAQHDHTVEDSEVELTRAQDKLRPHVSPEISSDYKPLKFDKKNEICALDVNDASNAPMCKYCEIVFFNRAIYFLHMGLHNVNNHWQCNVCGKVCKDAVDFAAHVIHM